MTTEQPSNLTEPAHATPRPLSLRRNFSWNLFGNIAYSACQWGMISVLAKLGSPEMVGQFSLGLAVTAPVILFASLNLRSAQASDAAHSYQFSDYFGLRLMTTAVALLFIAGLVVACGFRLDLALLIFMVGVTKGFETISDVIYGLLQKHERMDRIAQLRLIKGPSSLAALGLTLYGTGSLLYAVTAMAFVWAVQLLILDFRSALWILGGTAASFRPSFNGRILGRLMWLTLPLGITMTLLALTTTTPRYFMQYYYGEHDLGIFSAMAYLIVAGTTVVSAMAQSALPRLAKYYAENRMAPFMSLLLKLTSIGALLGFGGILVALVGGRQLLTWIYTEEFADNNNAFSLLMTAAAFSYVVICLNSGIVASRYFKISLVIATVLVSVSLASCFVLIPTQGLMGAAGATLITSASSLCLSIIAILFILRRKMSEGDAPEK